MAFALRLSAAIDALNRIIGQMMSSLILVCVLVSVATATARYVFAWGWNALGESQWFMFGLIFLLCAPWTLLERGHVRIDILSGHLSVKSRAVIELIGSLLFLLPICLLIIYHAWDYFLLSYAQNETSPNPGGLPWWPMKAAILLGFSLLALQGISESIKAWATLMGRKS